MEVKFKKEIRGFHIQWGYYDERTKSFDKKIIVQGLSLGTFYYRGYEFFLNDQNSHELVGNYITEKLTGHKIPIDTNLCNLDSIEKLKKAIKNKIDSEWFRFEELVSQNRIPTFEETNLISIL